MAYSEQFRRRRISIELERLESWVAHGRGSFHFEHSNALKPVIRGILRILGLYEMGNRNAASIRLRKVPFAFPDLPEAFEGFRILHLSDLHCDGIPRFAETLLNCLGDVSYDMCVITGDFRFSGDGPVGNVYREMKQLMEHLHCPHGIYGILGNHDALEMVDVLSGMGVTMLMNRAVSVTRQGQTIWIAGVDDPHFFGCDDLPEAMKDVPAGSFTLLLAHSPELYQEALDSRISLYLCGHTHGGQICFPGSHPILVNASCPRYMTSGKWSFGSLQGYTSPGTGSSMVPVRFFCPPEALIHELKTRKSQ